ncbi:hypothetical protein SK571_33850 [Lentzea sp. BCCO 10_0798]|uniref:DUF3592 domain-containing protein n=1 Tax=Lentzea kristufekii TaxID=3095430 RepID=A0ABU4U1G8_9PSEU|nr:DUF3592 domain-containing protein [Lentzea sp. BCCO 10_0798]MDX8054380.1 hypothetical protein [Lentzea sp. BCCO 10_0798]
MRRALGLVVTGLVLLVLFAVGTVLLDSRAADFEAHGVRVDGEVVAVHRGIRNSWTAEIRYEAAGVPCEGLVPLDHTGATVRPGDPIVVIHDPADHKRIAMPGVPNAPEWAASLMPLFALGGVGLFGGGLIRTFRAARAGRHDPP